MGRLVTASFQRARRPEQPFVSRWRPRLTTADNPRGPSMCTQRLNQTLGQASKIKKRISILQGTKTRRAEGHTSHWQNQNSSPGPSEFTISCSPSCHSPDCKVSGAPRAPGCIGKGHTWDRLQGPPRTGSRGDACLHWLG